MKKAGVFLIIILLFLAFVSAQSTADGISSGGSVPNSSIPSETKVAVRDAAEKLDSVVEKPVPIPEKLQPVAKILFGLEEDSSFSLFIITLAIWIIFALTFSNIMEFYSTFTKNTAIAVGFLLTIILAAIGLVRRIATLLINIGGNFDFLETWSAGALGFAVLIVIIFFIILRKILGYAKEYQLLRIARREGIEAGADLAVVKWMRKIFTSWGSSNSS